MIFPKRIDNTYGGYRAALWLLAAVVFVKLVMTTNIFINTRDIIKGPDGIALDSYGAAAAATLVQCFRSWAINHFVLAAMGLVALVRYRAMVPLMYLALTADGVARVALFLSVPLSFGRTAGPSLGLMINIGFAAVLLIGFALAISSPRSNENGPT